MGCCISRDLSAVTGANSNGESASSDVSAPSGGTSTSQPLASHPIRSQSDHSSTTRTPRSRSRRVFPYAVPLNVHYNQPIRPHVWKSKRRIWSVQQLARERKEFFETRVTGRREVWDALAAVTELMREGDIRTAQTILDAVGVTVPTGDLCEGCYDESGVLYRLPEAIVSDPTNVVYAPEEEESKYGNTTENFGDDEVSSSKLGVDIDSDEESVGDIEQRRDEKGKRNEKDLIRVRARLSDRGGPDITVIMGKEQSVGLLARKVQTEGGLSGKYRVRIAYLGKILNEHETLFAQGWKEGHVVNALVTNPLSN
ncbi:hypothetical protein VTO42DRAFT_9006 [Malbranchea cinnamomea]